MVPSGQRARVRFNDAIETNEAVTDPPACGN